MYNKYYFPKQHNAKWLDAVLAIGWFRMGQSVFTNQFVNFNNTVFRTVWLRHRLQDYQPSKTIGILHKRNKHFTAEFTPYTITLAHLQLYDTYKKAMPFSISDTIEDLLFCFAAKPEDVFNTHQINLYDGDQLIGCSFFDFGSDSAEGISSFYDPAYSQSSIGKYLIYLQLEFCVQNNFTYYYPGYFVPSYPHLDYKLTIGPTCLEFFDNETETWLPIQQYVQEPIPLDKKPLQDFFNK